MEDSNIFSDSALLLALLNNAGGSPPRTLTQLLKREYRFKFFGGAGRGSSLREKFYSYVAPEPNIGCWLWVGSYHPAGYGQIAVGKIPVGAHRVSWELHRGEIPEGMFVCHKCDFPPCVNPDHLFLGTSKENSRDMVNKGRHPKAKVTLAEAREIASSLETSNVLAARYGMSRVSINYIKNGTTWK